MTTKELIEQSKEAMKDLWELNQGKLLDYEQSAYNCLRLLCERLETSDNLAQKWEALRDEVAACYEQSEEEDDGLIGIGEIAATAFGYI